MGLGEEEAEMMLRGPSLENGEDDGDGGGLHEMWGKRVKMVGLELGYMRYGKRG